MKKTLIIVLSLVLVVVMTVAGTLAYFTAQTEVVKNTFTVGSLFDPDDPNPDPDPDDPDPDTPKFLLHEHEATADDSGVYTIGTDAKIVNGFDYTVLPGVDLPKDPFVRSTHNLAVDAYVFVEVVEDDFSEYLSYEVADTWTLLDGVKGLNGGKVYYLTAGAAAGAKLPVTYILDGNKITVDPEIPEGEDLGGLDFYAYMIQAAGFTDQAEAWAKGFGGSST